MTTSQPESWQPAQAGQERTGPCLSANTKLPVQLPRVPCRLTWQAASAAACCCQASGEWAVATFCAARSRSWRAPTSRAALRFTSTTSAETANKKPDGATSAARVQKSQPE
jgi:hypothetical protein